MTLQQKELSRDSLQRFSNLQIGRTWPLVSTSLFTARVWTGAAEIEVDDTAFTLVVSNPTSDTTLITATYNTDPLIVLRLYYRKVGLGFDFWYEKDTDASSRAVMEVAWPNTKVEPYGEPEDCYGFIGSYHGRSIWKPQSFVSNFTLVGESPAGIPAVGLWDTESRAILLAWADDEEGHAVCGQLIGQGSSTLLRFVHKSDRRYTPGQAFNKKYRVHLESFTGRSLHGRLCSEDICERLRPFFTHADRPWIAGPWRDRGDVAASVKKMNLFWAAQGTSPANMQADLTNLRAHLISGSPSVPFEAGHVLLYNWSPQAFETWKSPNFFNHPPQALSAGIITLTDTLTGLDYSIGIYTIAHKWANTGLAGTAYDPNNFVVNITDPLTGLPLLSTTYAELRNFAYKDRTGATKVAVEHGDPYFDLDSVKPETKYVMFEVLQRYLAAFTGAAEVGIVYLDNLPGIVDAHFPQDDPAATTWTHAKHWASQKELFDFVRTLARSKVNKAMAFTSENQSHYLIPNKDYVLDINDPPTVGPVACQGTHRIFGEFVPVVSFGTQFVDFFLSDPKSVYPAIQYITYHWLHNGIIQAINSAAAPTVVTPIDGSHTYDPIWDWCKVLHRARPYLKKYFEGRILRTPGGSCADYRNAVTGQNTRGELIWNIYEAGQFHVQVECHKAADGDVAVILANTIKSGLVPPFHALPAAYPQTVTVILDACAHELPAGEKKLYVRDLATGVRTLLTTFKNRVEVTRTIAAFSIEALEVSLT